MSGCTVNVFVPMYNNLNILDETIESVRALNYDQKKIFLFLMDFGSTDGMREKILHYSGARTAFFSLAGRRVGRTMVADMMSAAHLQAIGRRSMVLWPGDVLYPHCFSVAEKYLWRVDRAGMRCGWLAAEVDVRDAEGVVRQQIPLFTKPCYLRAFSIDSSEYVKKGWRHTVLTYGGGYHNIRDKIRTQQNLGYWWNCLVYQGIAGGNLSYVNEPLGCFRERVYDDELDEILFRFEMGLTLFRMRKEVPEGHVMDEGFEAGYRLQLSKYALWRSFLLAEKGAHKEAEDCFLMSRIINPKIAREECWQRVERLLKRVESSDHAWLQEWFSCEEPPDKPKWPIGGAWSMGWQKLMQRFGKEKVSVWG